MSVAVFLAGVIVAVSDCFEIFVRFYFAFLIFVPFFPETARAIAWK